jgi:hypothetical protein
MNYYILVMSQKEFFENQVFEEILRERVNYYVSKNQVIDFWISTEPKLLKTFFSLKNFKNTKFYKRTKEKNSYSCLISTNKEFINWIQLRLGFFENIDDIKEDKDYYSDGLSLIIKNIKSQDIKSNCENLDSNILYSKYLLTRNFLQKDN